MSNRLTKAELSAVLGVAGDALAEETLSTDANPEAAMLAFESGMAKLRAQLAAKSKNDLTEEEMFWRKQANAASWRF